MDPAIRSTRRRIKAAVLLGVVTLGSPQRDSLTGSNRVLRGIWDSDHLVIDVQGALTLAQFDCAHGRIETPIVLDADGAFSVPGTYSREHGGPIRDSENVPGLPARYSGQVRGDLMIVTITAEDRRVGTFELRRGSSGRVFGCL